MSLAYYEENADAFFDRTAHAEIPHLWKPFLDLLPAGGRILDIGCGSGRDSLYFLKKGYDVLSADPSPAMRERAARLTGRPIADISFQKLEAKEEFDGIWACASLLHVKKSEMAGVLTRLVCGLKAGGVLYASFKERDEEWEEDGRLFTGYDRQGLARVLSANPQLKAANVWVTEDVGRKGLFWVNALAQRK